MASSQWAQRNSGFIPPSRLGQPEPRREFTSGPLPEPSVPVQPRPQPSPAPAAKSSSFFSFGKKTQPSPPPAKPPQQQQPTPASSPPPTLSSQLHQPQPQQHSPLQTWRDVGRINSGSTESFGRSLSGAPPAPNSQTSHTGSLSKPYSLPPDTRRQSSYETHSSKMASPPLHSRQMSEGGHSSIGLSNRLQKQTSREPQPSGAIPAHMQSQQRPQHQQHLSTRSDASSAPSNGAKTARTLHPELRSVVALNIARMCHCTLSYWIVP